MRTTKPNLRLEPLEDRSVPSVSSVANPVSDFSGLEIRCFETAQQPGTIPTSVNTDVVIEAAGSDQCEPLLPPVPEFPLGDSLSPEFQPPKLPLYPPPVYPEFPLPEPLPLPEPQDSPMPTKEAGKAPALCEGGKESRLRSVPPEFQPPSLPSYPLPVYPESPFPQPGNDLPPLPLPLPPIPNAPDSEIPQPPYPFNPESLPLFPQRFGLEIPNLWDDFLLPPWPVAPGPELPDLDSPLPGNGPFVPPPAIPPVPPLNLNWSPIPGAGPLLEPIIQDLVIPPTLAQTGLLQQLIPILLGTTNTNRQPAQPADPNSNEGFLFDYFKEDPEGGYALGGGLYRHFGTGGDSLGLFTADLLAGRWGEEGQRRGGIKAAVHGLEANSGEIDLGNNFFVKITGRALTANAEASAGQDGASLQAGAAFVEADITIGKSDASQDDDVQARLGVSVGVGGGGRLHWSDEDGDGVREYGFGADIIFVSFDVKSEDPIKTILIGAGPQLILDGFGVSPTDNWTQTTLEVAEDFGEAVQETGQEFIEEVTERTEEFVEEVTEAAEELRDEIVERAETLVEEAQEFGENLIEEAKELGEEALEKAEQVKDAVVETVEEFAEGVKDLGNQALEGAKSFGGTVVNGLGSLWETGTSFFG
ncbi:MAG: YtxH domain-containing protein [Gemmataceae bacterium]